MNAYLPRMVRSNVAFVTSVTTGPVGFVKVGIGRRGCIGVSSLLLNAGLSFLLLNPIAKMLLAGGGSVLFVWIGLSVPGLAGILGGCSSLVLEGSLGASSPVGLEDCVDAPLGLGGIFGARSRSTGGGSRRCTFGVDLAVTSGSFPGFVVSSRSLLEGGRGGSFASPKAGGSLLCESTDEAVVLCPNDMPDIVELNDIVESFEPRRVNCVDVLRGGRAGEGCDAFREGSAGGPLQAGRPGDFALLELVGCA